jgi:hypothetical protein
MSGALCSRRARGESVQERGCKALVKRVNGYLAALFSRALRHVGRKVSHATTAQLPRCTACAVAAPIVLAALLQALFDGVEAAAEPVLAVDFLPRALHHDGEARIAARRGAAWRGGASHSARTGRGTSLRFEISAL